MQPLDAYLNAVVWGLIGAIPWVVGIGVAAGILGWSPLGRLLMAYLRDRGRNDALLEANNAELSEVARALGSMAERLDATERLLLNIADREATRATLPRSMPDHQDVRIPTPH